MRLREVKCYQGEALGQGCELGSKPEARQACQLQPCPIEAPGKMGTVSEGGSLEAVASLVLVENAVALTSSVDVFTPQKKTVKTK